MRAGQNLVGLKEVGVLWKLLLHLREDLPAGVHTRLDRAYEQLERMAEIVRSLARTSRPRTVGYVGQTRILDLSSDTE